MIITVLNTKGGVGKTTTSIYLAFYASKGGHSVRLLDADPQGSSTSWAARAAEAGTPLPFTVAPAAGDLAAGARGPESVVVIDTPPGYEDHPDPVREQLLDSAADAADLVVIPTRVTAGDLDRLGKTLQMCTHRPAVAVGTFVDGRTNAARYTPAALREAGVPLLYNMAPYSSAAATAFGRYPVRSMAYADVYRELMDAYASLSGNNGDTSPEQQ